MTDLVPSEHQEPRRRRSLMLAALALLVIVVAAALIWWFVLRDVRGDVWEETTVDIDPACARTEQCETFLEVPLGHTEDVTAELQYDPDVDTPVAQWGDCLDAVFVCLEDRIGDDPESAGRADAIRACVAEAQTCPAACRDRFATRAQGLDFAELEAEFFSEFVDEGGWCVPREADR